MTDFAAASPSSPRLIAATKRLPFGWQVAAVGLGTALLTVSSWIAVPMIPVPITMQTLAVTLIGAFCGWRLAGLTVLAWLAEAAVGLPVLSAGHSGLAYMAGPTGGYLSSFVPCAALVGWAAERGWTRSIVKTAGLMLVANALMIAMGASWLSVFVGTSNAVVLGVVPFLVGGVLKSALAAVVVAAGGRSARA